MVIAQVAALPYRLGVGGQTEVMLITSRSDGQHWLPSKGHLIDGLEPHQAAAQEAHEEARVIGEVSAEPIGQYRGAKSGADGCPRELQITVYPMQFLRRDHDWPEKGQRSALWFELCDAARAVREPGLARLIASFRPFPRSCNKDEEALAKSGKAPARPLLLFEANGGRFVLVGRNDHIVLRTDEGGQCDPFLDGDATIAVKGRYFTVQNGVACGAHWTDYITFRLDDRTGGFVFDNERTESWMLNPSNDPNAEALVRDGPPRVVRDRAGSATPFAAWRPRR